MNRAYRFRIKPNKAQREFFAKQFGCVRFLYNQMLADKIQHYELTKEMLKNTPAQYKAAHPFLKEVDSLALCNTQLHLQTAFRNFLQNPDKFGFPNFKKKHDGHNSYTTNHVNGNIQLKDGYLKLPKVGQVKIKQHRSIPESYRLKSVTVSMTPTGKYYASILYEFVAEIAAVAPVRVLGLDFSMPDLFVTSEGQNAAYPQFYRKTLDKLRFEQRKLSKCQKGSNNWIKQKRKVANLHERITNQRKDSQHKWSRQIASDWDAVCLETLNMKAMSQALHFGKSVHDVSWGRFTTFLTYKLEEQGKQLVKIDPWFPSSKTCSCCGTIKETLLLGERVYRCNHCGFVGDRDHNAAINIRNQGMLQLIA